VEGEAGTDTLVFNGANINERMDISANGERARLTRDVGNITMDLNGVEHIQVNALGGADTITVNDLTGTDVTRVALDLSAPAGSGQGDGAADTVKVNGTAGDDHINVASSGASVVVNGLAAQGTSPGAEGDKASLVIDGFAGNDTINASALNPGQINLTINGGAGNDTITGSRGNDVVIGGTGNDVALLGAGDDTFIWNPGDASDKVEGQAGTDTLRVNGANIDESIDISANGSRARLTRDVRNFTMDLNGGQDIEVNARGSADTVTVNDLTGTGREPGRHRPRRTARQPRRRWRGGHDRPQCDQRQRRDHDREQQRHRYSVGPARGGDDLQLRGERSHRHQWPRRRRRHHGVRADGHALHRQWRRLRRRPPPQAPPRQPPRRHPAREGGR